MLVDAFNKVLDICDENAVRSSTTVGVNRGSSGTLLNVVVSPSSDSGFTFKIYNKSSGSTGQIQCNGGDGFVAQLNSFIAQVSGVNNDTKTGSPPDYPKLAVTGNGVIYVYATLDASGNILTLNIFYAGTIPFPDPATPPTYAAALLATVSNYASSSGNISFDLANAQSTGYSNLVVCGNTVTIF